MLYYTPQGAGTKKRPRPARAPVFFEEEILIGCGHHVDPAAAAVELNHAALQGEDREITAEADVAAREKFAPALAHENVAGKHFLSAEFFHAETFADAVAAVLDAALSFLVGHMLGCAGGSGFDLSDLHTGEFLTVADRAVITLAAAKFVGDELRALALLENFGGHLGAFN